MAALALDNKVIAYHAEFTKMLGSLQAGIFLSQLYYWHDKGHRPDGWIYKTQQEWYEETGLTRKAQETARRILKEKGILKEKLAGNPATVHYLLKVKRLNQLLEEYRESLFDVSKPAKLVCPDSSNKIAQDGHTIISDNTSQITFVVVQEETEKKEDKLCQQVQVLPNTYHPTPELSFIQDVNPDPEELPGASASSDATPQLEPATEQIKQIVELILDATGYVANHVFAAGLLKQWNFDYVYRKIDKLARYSRINESVAGFIIRACERNYPEPVRKVKGTKYRKNQHETCKQKQKKETGNSYSNPIDETKKLAMIKKMYMN